MRSFISHNKNDRDTAHLLAALLVLQGIDVWFDEWDIEPGDSISGGIEKGLTDSDVFVLLWSKNAKRSEWVTAEWKAFLTRKIAACDLRIIPLMLDDTPLPLLIGDYKGFRLNADVNLEQVAASIAGKVYDRELARRLQNRLLELAAGWPGGPLPYVVCPNCGSDDLRSFQTTDYANEDHYHCIDCNDCSWSGCTT